MLQPRQTSAESSPGEEEQHYNKMKNNPHMLTDENELRRQHNISEENKGNVNKR